MSLTPSLGSLGHLATDALVRGVALPARAYGVAKGTAAAGARLVGYGTGQATSPWQTADRVVPTIEPSRPVNVHEKLGLDPAPADRVRTPRTPPVTDIDAQAEPRLVDSTPADVAERIARSR